jgi:hypothetical protein
MTYLWFLRTVVAIQAIVLAVGIRWCWYNAWDLHYYDPHARICRNGEATWEPRHDGIALFGCYGSDRPTANPSEKP